MQVLRGTFEEVMNMKPSDDIIKVELEDENTIISPMEEIKKRFKNAKMQFYTVPNSTHDYNEHEKQISKLIIDSIRNMENE